MNRFLSTDVHIAQNLNTVTVAPPKGLPSVLLSVQAEGDYSLDQWSSHPHRCNSFSIPVELNLPVQQIARTESVAMSMPEMKGVISGITLSRARADPSECIALLNPLLSTAEGRRLLSDQQGEKSSVLIDLFDWVTIPLHSCPFSKD